MTNDPRELAYWQEHQIERVKSKLRHKVAIMRLDFCPKCGDLPTLQMRAQWNHADGIAEGFFLRDCRCGMSVLFAEPEKRVAESRSIPQPEPMRTRTWTPEYGQSAIHLCLVGACVSAGTNPWLPATATDTVTLRQFFSPNGVFKENG